jgi:GTPase SAR1 family protein
MPLTTYNSVLTTHHLPYKLISGRPPTHARGRMRIRQGQGISTGAEGYRLMAEATPQPGPAVVAGRDTVRIVLFGMPAAGKTSLLGALAQSARTQEHLLHGRIEDPSHGLAELQHRLYDEEPSRTAEEVVPYVIDFEPFSNERPTPRAHIGATLIDCDGRVANDLLLRRSSLPEGSPEGSLAREVLAADTLVLVVDTSAPPARVDADFGEFVRFLKLLERSRGERSEVGGLPIFMVLTKCDLLAQPTDTPVTWLERITDRKHQVASRFHQFLANQSSENERRGEECPLPFGRLDLHVAATAVKRPPLADIPAKPREPFGVAELFNDCLGAARSFRQRRRRSGRLLLWTVAGAGVVVAGMVVLAAALMLGAGRSDPRHGSLQIRAERLKAEEGESPAERLRGDLRTLEEKTAVLSELQSNPDFDSLPEALHGYIQERLEEVQAYTAYFRKLQRGKQPADARNHAELESLEETLRVRGGNGLAVPRDDWSQTRAARLHDDRLADLKLLRRSVEETEGAYQQKKREGEQLWALAGYQPRPEASVNWRGWHQDVRAYLSTVAKPLVPPESERLPGASSSDLTFQTVYAFENVRRAAAELESVKKRLEGLRDLIAALGLGGSADLALLVFPPGSTAAACAERLNQLRQAFPDFEKSFAELKLPDAARGDIRQAAQTSFKNLLETGREVVLARLREASPGGPETTKTWQTIRPWLAEPAEFSAWRALARLLLRLVDPERADLDPVADLVAFLARDKFELNLQGMTLQVPETVKVRPDGDLVIYLTESGTKKNITLLFSVENKSRKAERGVISYTVRPKAGSALTYHPGDDLNVELPVLDAENRPMKLTWGRGRSQVYQFEHLTREPRLHARDALPATGQIEPGIRLQPASGQEAVPRVPDLVPVVKLDKQ